MPETFNKTTPTRYSIGLFGISIPSNMFRTFALIYYVEEIGLDLKLFSLITIIATIADTVNNLLCGYLSDRTRTRWGRRRPWLVMGAPFFTLSFFLFYMSPANINHDMIFVYCLVIYTITSMLESLIFTNYNALFAELFTAEGERAKTNAIRYALQFAGMIISVAATPVIAEVIGFSYTALIFAVIGCAVILYSTLGCHENPANLMLEKPNLFYSMKNIIKNKNFWINSITITFYNAAMTLVMSSLPLFTKYTLQATSMEQSILFALIMLTAILAVGVWAALVKKIRLLKLWRISLLTLFLAFIPLYFAGGFISAAIASCIIGLGYAGVIMTSGMVCAKIIDDDANQNGIRREGIYSSVTSLMIRLQGIFSAIAIAAASALYGYNSGSDPGGNPGGTARFLIIACPMLYMLLSYFISRYITDKRSITTNND